MGVRFLPLVIVVLVCHGGNLLGQKKPRAIGGRVSGVDGKPVVGAEVILRWRVHPELPSLMGYTLGRGGLAEKVVKSGEKGRFRIQPPNVGPFLLVTKAGKTSSTQVFPVLHGDYHDLRLEPNYYMGGVVLGADGKPVAGAEVRLQPMNGLQLIRLGLYRQPGRRASVKTDANGRFSMHFEHGYLRDPRWNTLMVLQAEHEGVLSSLLDYQRPTNASKNVTLRLAGRRSYDVTVTDQATGKPIAGVQIFDPLAPGRKIVTDENGKCKAPPKRGESVFLIAPGYRATLYSASSDLVSISMMPGLTLRTTLSGPKGPLTGARILLATPLGNACPIEWHDTVGEDGKVEIRTIPSGQMVLAFVEIDGRFVKFFEGVSGRDTTLAPIQLKPERQIRGRVLTAKRMPIAGVRVGLQSLASNRTNPRRVTYTDRAGRFLFESVSAADHMVIAAKGKHGQASVTIAKREWEAPVTITLNPPTTIGGRVLRPDGKPAAGAWVSIHRNASGAFIRGPRNSSTCLGTMTDAEGRFRFGVSARTTWSIVAATLHEGSHYNYSASTSAGTKTLVLKLVVANR
jgi:uncharacterized GH25 family protein